MILAIYPSRDLQYRLYTDKQDMVTSFRNLGMDHNRLVEDTDSCSQQISQIRHNKVEDPDYKQKNIEDNQAKSLQQDHILEPRNILHHIDRNCQELLVIDLHIVHRYKPYIDM